MATGMRCLVVAWAMLFASMAWADNTRTGVAVTGKGQAWVEPDVARFRFDVVRQGGDVAALRRAVDQTVRQVLELAERLQVDERDVTAAVIQVLPNYVYQNGQQFIDGVIVRRHVQINLRNLEHYGELVEGILAAGINQIQSVNLDVAEPQELHRRALDTAIADARREAEHVAAQFGMRLGRVVEIDVDPAPLSPFPTAEFAQARADVGGQVMSPGRISVERSVRARFALLHGES
jgi:uncharacterized protein